MLIKRDQCEMRMLNIKSCRPNCAVEHSPNVKMTGTIQYGENVNKKAPTPCY